MFKRYSLSVPFCASLLATLGLAAYFSGTVSLQKKNVDVRKFESAVAISVNRSSPAFAALEDVLQDFEYSEDQYVSQYAPMEQLAAGNDFVYSAEQIIADNQRVITETAQAKLLAQKSTQENIRKLQAFLQSAFAPREQGKPHAQEVHAVATNSEEENDLLVVANGKIEKFSASAVEAAAGEVRTIKLAELKIDKKELLKSLFLPLVTAENAAQALKKNYSSGKQREEKPKKSEDEIEPQSLDTFTVSGNIEMAGGTAVTSSKDQLVVYREVDGERQESGYVWLKEARYEIYLERNDGDLVAELYTPAGQLIGRGDLDLTKVRQTDPRLRRAEGVNLKLQPVTRGLYGRAQSAYSYGNKIDPVVNAEVSVRGIDGGTYSQKDGSFANEELSYDSTVITRTTRANYWGTLAFAEVGLEKNITLFPSKMMSAFASVVGARGEALRDQPPVIWGKVTLNGKPVAGAKVELLTGDEPLQPIYFNALMIPDASLSSTSANGLYAFYPVEPGVQVLQASLSNQTLEPVVIPAEAGYVSNVDLEIVRNQKITMKVFDAFQTNVPVAAQVRILGSEQVKTVGNNGEIQLQLAKNNGLVVADIDAGSDYAITRVGIPNHKRAIHAPMIDAKWIESIRTTERISKNPDSGVIVGFVQAAVRYQVSISEENSSAEIKTVYFDRNGRVLEGNVGVPGGGYIVFNVPEGITTTALVGERMSGMQAITALAEKSVVNVVHHSLK